MPRHLTRRRGLGKEIFCVLPDPGAGQNKEGLAFEPSYLGLFADFFEKSPRRV
jgi:hypothetical protein